MAGTRNTKQKKIILSLLKNAKQPLTAGEIYTKALKIQPNIAKSTIYRNLDAMLSRNEIKQGMLQSGESFYSLSDGQDHLNYLICKKCNCMLDFPKCPLGDLEHDIAKSLDFEITDHMLQIYGYCRKCKEIN